MFDSPPTAKFAEGVRGPVATIWKNEFCRRESNIGSFCRSFQAEQLLKRHIYSKMYTSESMASVWAYRITFYSRHISQITFRWPTTCVTHIESIVIYVSTWFWQRQSMLQYSTRSLVLKLPGHNFFSLYIRKENEKLGWYMKMKGFENKYSSSYEP